MSGVDEPTPDEPTLAERVASLEKRHKNQTVRGFAFAFICFAILFYVDGFHDRTLAIAECERGNDARETQLDLFDDLVEINQGRVEAASSPAEREANEYAVEQYAAGRAALIAAEDEVAEEPGGVRTNCEEVSPAPVPFG